MASTTSLPARASRGTVRYLPSGNASTTMSARVAASSVVVATAPRMPSVIGPVSAALRSVGKEVTHHRDDGGAVELDGPSARARAQRPRRIDEIEAPDVNHTDG